MELTKEHFEKTLEEKFSKVITEKILTQKLDEQTIELKTFTKEQIEELARMTKEGFDDVMERLDVKDRMQKLETEMAKIKTALHLS